MCLGDLAGNLWVQRRSHPRAVSHRGKQAAVLMSLQSLVKISSLHSQALWFSIGTAQWVSPIG